ncbi:hypothetical protein SASPL_120013 [Salvia splendens]|uniref:UspA domain-containing protein n=1 Tax=Salvia splendens TaxID=180675 RepID=A0A8X8XPQ6_SALSN|nr:hypothetical protein SASPL_120013 [Salvia splendens]
MDKSVMVVGIDDSDHSLYALEWTLKHLFSPAPEKSPFKLVKDVKMEGIEGDPRNALCDAVDKHNNNASVLVVGSHGYGAIKR